MSAESSPSPNVPWFKLLNRYHWFVFVVAALGWLFDTMDQQLFNLARVPAMKALVTTQDMDPGAAAQEVSLYAGYATSIFLIGWATGGMAFGIMGDRIGRAKTMLLTILVYSLFTGMSALSFGFWDFALWRFLTGLGVGGEFAVGVSLVAEVMPSRARTHALGLLQALSAVGNVAAALISILLGQLEESGAIDSAWRLMFVIGTVPALVAILIRRRLKEPEQWQRIHEAPTGIVTAEALHGVAAAEIKPAAPQKLGSLAELFGDPRWRNRTIMGVVLATAGVIGLWGIGFFAFDLNRSIFRKSFEAEARVKGEAVDDAMLVFMLLHHPDNLPEAARRIKPQDLLNSGPKVNDVQLIYKTMIDLDKAHAEVSPATMEAALKQKGKERVLASIDYPAVVGMAATEKDIRHVEQRTGAINGRLTLWVGITSIMFNLAGFFGVYSFSVATHYTGRRVAFAISFTLALVSTAWVFWTLNNVTDVFWMIPIMGFCQLSIFGGYAIYFPELFPTRLRSTGTSFCYNVGRYAAAVGPSALGLLTGVVFKDYEEPMRYAGVTMCGVFLLGLAVLPFAPETKGKPLPE